MDITFELIKGDELSLNLQGGELLELTPTIPISQGIQPYDGEYRITPTTSAQIILVADKRMRENLVIDPIPNNYGSISWNGSTLTVS